VPGHLLTTSIYIVTPERFKINLWFTPVKKQVIKKVKIQRKGLKRWHYKLLKRLIAFMLKIKGLICLFCTTLGTVRDLCSLTAFFAEILIVFWGLRLVHRHRYQRFGSEVQTPQTSSQESSAMFSSQQLTSSPTMKKAGIINRDDRKQSLYLGRNFLSL